MPRQRFDDLWSALRQSSQPKDGPWGVSYAEHKWMLINDIVDIFNQHRGDNFIPGEWTCANKSISQWHGLRDHWIHIGLPMYVTIARKPESGCEIQKNACSKSGVILFCIIYHSSDVDRSGSKIHLSCQIGNINFLHIISLFP